MFIALNPSRIHNVMRTALVDILKRRLIETEELSCWWCVSAKLLKGHQGEGECLEETDLKSVLSMASYEI